MNNSKIIIGTAQLTNNYGIYKHFISDQNIKEILTFAQRENITYLDTAVDYNKVHYRLGEFDLSKYNIISKIPKLDNDTQKIRKEIRNLIEKSLKELNVLRLDGLLMHDLEDINNTEKRSFIIKELLVLKKEKLIENVGLSIYSPYILDSMKNLEDIDIIQAPLNLIDQRIVRSSWMEKLNNMGVKIHVRSIFLQGLLLADQNFLDKNFKTWNLLWSKWFTYLEENNNINPIKVCIDFIRSHQNIDKIIVGINSIDQLREINSYFNSGSTILFPDILSNDEKLVDPFNWNK